jgi:hypothetical protein
MASNQVSIFYSQSRSLCLSLSPNYELINITELKCSRILHIRPIFVASNFRRDQLTTPNCRSTNCLSTNCRRPQARILCVKYLDSSLKHRCDKSKRGERERWLVLLRADSSLARWVWSTGRSLSVKASLAGCLMSTAIMSPLARWLSGLIVIEECLCLLGVSDLRMISPDQYLYLSQVLTELVGI